MKNKLKSIVVLCFAFIVGMNVVSAATKLDNELEKMVNEKTALRLCMYKNPTSGDVEGAIYYLMQTKYAVQNLPTSVWSVQYRKGNKLAEFGSSPGPFNTMFNKHNISYGTYKSYISSSSEKTFVCPKNFFIDYSFIDELCLSEYESCSDHFKEGPFPVDIEYDTIYKKIDDKFYTFLTDPSAVKDFLEEEDLTANLRDKVKNFIVKDYSFNSNSKMPEFLDNYIKNFKFDEDSQEFKSAIEAIKKESQKQVDEQVKKGEISEEEGQKKKEEIQNKQANEIIATKSSTNSNVNLNITSGTDCDSILGKTLSNIIKNLFKFVQYLGPILVIVFSAMDFIKAAMSGDDGQIKKSSSRLGKRIACGILLFFVPLICGFLLDLGGVTMPDICIKQNN